MSVEPRVGDVVDGTYALQREFSRAHQAGVFEARHVDSGRSCVVEVTGSARSFGRGTRRLLREAQLLSVARRASVPELLGVGQCPVHGPYMAVELLHGRTLDGLLAARGPLAIPELGQLASALCDALCGLHDTGIVHRDLRLSNVLLSPTKEGDRVVLLDLELAVPLHRFKESGKFVRSALTALTEPLIAGPDGEHEEATDDSLDVMGIAALLFELATGRNPFEAPSSSPSSNGRPPLAHALRPELPPAFSDALDAALDPNGHDFPDSVRAFAWSIADSIGPRTLGLRVLSASNPRIPSRRKGQRVEYCTPARLRAAEGFADGSAADISEHGMLFLTSGALPACAEFLVSFALPSTGQFIEVPAAVRWSRTQGARTAVGLEFLEIAPLHASELALYALLRAHETPAADDRPRARREAVSIPAALLAMIA